MQSAPISFSAPFPLSSNHRKLVAIATFNTASLRHSEQPRLRNASSLSFLANSSLGKLSSSIGCSMKPDGLNPDHLIPVDPEANSDGIVVQAAEESAAAEKLKRLMDILVLGSLFGISIMFNINFNIRNKLVLEAFHYPYTVTLGQFLIGTVLVTLMWTLNLRKRPKISGAQLAAIFPLAAVHTLSSLFTNMSLGKVAVSFTQTIKAMEPFFSVFLSAMFLGEAPTIWVISSLIPIVGGVGLASLTEVSFNWAGFWSAMASNLMNQSRNVLSKKLMVNNEDSLDNFTLFSVITIMSFVLILPPTLFMEWVKFTPPYLQASGVNINQIYIMSLLAALTYHAYQQIDYMILDNVSPVTHSVANCFKRVMVIVASVLFFGTPISPINCLGTGIALAGVFLYSRVRSIKPKPKPKMV